MYRRMFSTLALLLCLGMGSQALAQTITGRISGTVTDSTGATVPGATVIIINEATQQTRNVMADSNGFYVATNLPVGNYSVSVEFQGFKKSKRTGYDLVADGRLSVDFTLETGSVTESVEIVASTAGNKVVEEAVNNARESIRQGETLAKPLGESEIFPPMVVRMIAIGEKSGALEQLLEKISEFYDQQVEAMVEGLTALIEPLMIGIMGLMVGGIVLSVFLPIFKIQDALRKK